MSMLAEKTVKNYGYDTQNLIEYSFNSLGFRSPEPSKDPSLVVIGNSISFGIKSHRNIAAILNHVI